MNAKAILVTSVFLMCLGLNCFGQSTELDLSIKVPGYVYTEEDYQYRINGISTVEDIGGVEVAKGTMTRPGYYRISFENFNSFTVTVIFQTDVNTYDGRSQGRRSETGTVVLRPGEKRETQDIFWDPGNFILISRKLSS